MSVTIRDVLSAYDIVPFIDEVTRSTNAQLASAPSTTAPVPPLAPAVLALEA
jgi:hypothetical protein